MSQQTSRRRPIVVDLFASAGGLSLGFEQAGFDVVASVEIDPIHAAVHHFNFPMSVAICRSVVDVSGQLIRDQAGIGHQDIDAVCGGAPCQGFSTIGKRALDDPRNGLVHHFCRLVSELRPKYAVFENVRGLTTPCCAVTTWQPRCAPDRPTPCACAARPTIRKICRTPGNGTPSCSLPAPALRIQRCRGIAFGPLRWAPSSR